jgi:hypothetical protein
MKRVKLLPAALLGLLIFSTPLVSSDIENSGKQCPFLQKFHDKEARSACPYKESIKKSPGEQKGNELKCPYSGKPLREKGIKLKKNKLKYT